MYLPPPRRSWKSKWRRVKPFNWNWCLGTTGNRELGNRQVPNDLWRLHLIFENNSVFGWGRGGLLWIVGSFAGNDGEHGVLVLKLFVREASG